jgi:hypothetical protein
MKQNLYEITVERKVREKHTVVARSRTEAAVAFANPEFVSLDEVSREIVDERVLTPKLLREGFDPDQMTLDDVIDEPPADDPTGDADE